MRHAYFPSGSLVVTVLAAALLSLAARVPYSSLENRANSTFLSCLEHAGLDPVVQGEAAYATDSAPFNLRFKYKPAAIVYPKDAAGVAAAVKCGAAHGVKVNARGGGHSYAAFALGGEDGHLTVSLDNLRHLSVSGDTATIGGGNHLGDVALYLWQHGKRALAHGTCPYVGIGGHAGQGGFGIPSRLWGLLADQITSIELVTASGSILPASPSRNADLFWAAMGAGASVGIITQFTAATHKAVDSVAFSYSFANYGAKEASRGLLAWQRFASDPGRPLDAELGLQLHVNPGSTPSGISFSVSGSYYNADIAKLNATMAPLLTELGRPTATTMQTQDWITSVLYYAGAQNLNGLNTTLAPDVHDHFYATSTFVSEHAPLGKPSADALMQYFYGLGTKTNVGWFIIFDLYGGPKSAIRRRNADFNAFDARDALYSIQYYGSFPSNVADATGIAFIQGMKGALERNQPHTVFKEYVNYIDSTYSADVAHRKYYPTHTARLTEIKNKYDPHRVFHYPQDF
ncbi:FAD-binding domain-containing protein [Lentinus tigrinus ALCF2SS1-6]|uniref:FAD-binding domain-containing protein n=1 Tax=Lentinus tigrinus ALCF2SS1-6 TaxID=1328759 RepID=A0A5C2SCD2_9APHY|nr:FAD-binding domain-containing protein [Lentinus tigrinus ALCF2SS1-6]